MAAADGGAAAADSVPAAADGGGAAAATLTITIALPAAALKMLRLFLEGATEAAARSKKGAVMTADGPAGPLKLQGQEGGGGDGCKGRAFRKHTSGQGSLPQA